MTTITAGSKNRIWWSIAWRYLMRTELVLLIFLWPVFILLYPFRKRLGLRWPKFNAIHLISMVSILGLVVGTAALILVLAVFNGFEDLLTGLFARFNPDVKIMAAEGKYFEEDTLVLAKLRAMPEVGVLSCAIEEVAFFDYEGIQDFGTIKGVDANFNRINGIDSCVVEGAYITGDDERSMAVLGGGMRNKLSVNVENFITPLSVFMPKRGKVGVLEQPFTQMALYPAGTFLIQQEFDDRYVITNLTFVRDLLGADNLLSSLEIAIKPGANMRATSKKIADFLGPKYKVQDRMQQDAAFIKLVNIEKWLSFAILTLTLVLVVFNLIGCLWMIVLDKRTDIATLKSLGATDQSIYGLVMRLGALLCSIGVAMGFFLALSIYIYHKQYGLFTIPQGFVVSAYPAMLRFSDFILVGLLVFAMSLIATIPAARKAKSISALQRSA